VHPRGKTTIVAVRASAHRARRRTRAFHCDRSENQPPRLLHLRADIAVPDLTSGGRAKIMNL
jgi:hypothetical protein